MNIDLRPGIDSAACTVLLGDLAISFRTLQDAQAFVATLRRRIAEPHPWPRTRCSNAGTIHSQALQEA
ncbi:hypothetical protein [Pseudomonas sp.]|uniref:hypothetical protein n=1 Tax=Pseudomonas sp. TaxID=306 RepID=UPI0013035BCE|nr:hypothetical protein [Pseudomonas sp.]